MNWELGASRFDASHERFCRTFIDGANYTGSLLLMNSVVPAASTRNIKRLGNLKIWAVRALSSVLRGIRRRS